VRKFYKKLTNRYLNSFKISEKINNNVYRLKLSNQYKKLNDFFHVNFLKFYMQKTGEEFPNPILIDKNDKFLVNRLLNERISKRKTKYLIK
jgi:hypothetical protein